MIMWRIKNVNELLFLSWIKYQIFRYFILGKNQIVKQQKLLSFAKENFCDWLNSEALYHSTMFTSSRRLTASRSRRAQVRGCGASHLNKRKRRKQNNFQCVLSANQRTVPKLLFKIFGYWKWGNESFHFFVFSIRKI